jgi:uncharacterized membrane protein YphA (DoxX/SURF4 family)
MNISTTLTSSRAPVCTVLIRLMVGAVFMSEGIQKFLFPGDLGAGRFATIGLPSPGVLAPLVGTFEIGCGLLVVLGLLTRVAVIPLLVIILTAIWKTKLPLLLKSGLWRMAHAVGLLVFADRRRGAISTGCAKAQGGWQGRQNGDLTWARISVAEPAALSGLAAQHPNGRVRLLSGNDAACILRDD